LHWSIALCINNSCKRPFQWTDTSHTLDSRTCQDVYWGWGWWSWTSAANSAIKALCKYCFSFLTLRSGDTWHSYMIGNYLRSEGLKYSTATFSTNYNSKYTQWTEEPVEAPILVYFVITTL
jgi:hypothetical protein